ncbi:RNA-binding cell elongation regulator Jag/EloR [Anaerosinus massiliensis]|uniref:RNA-binding cell elongation regulator Jag/EloR n=1 Tax=Massilibacillus massiliensis TaxID=1806837 RepID=UPI000AB100E2|nr:RNA-binding cell elongation regulator Jag/EloR [Massilibacillus massiliensis]
MLTVVEKTGKTIEEALAAALMEFNVSEDRVAYEVIDMPSKGFLGLIGSKPAKIKVSLKKLPPVEIAIQFLEDLFKSMKIAVLIKKIENENGYVFDLQGEDLGILIGKHGQTLDALQYLTNLAANQDMSEAKVRIILDVENYRKRRQETLCRLANRLADKVKRFGDKIVLEPMSRHERKVIHTALQEDPKILTYSDGEEPYRKVVITLKR